MRSLIAVAALVAAFLHPMFLAVGEVTPASQAVAETTMPSGPQPGQVVERNVVCRTAETVARVVAAAVRSIYEADLALNEAMQADQCRGFPFNLDVELVERLGANVDAEGKRVETWEVKAPNASEDAPRYYIWLFPAFLDL